LCWVGEVNVNDVGIVVDESLLLLLVLAVLGVGVEGVVWDKVRVSDFGSVGCVVVCVSVDVDCGGRVVDVGFCCGGEGVDD